MAKAAQELTVRDYTQVESTQRDLEKQLRQKEWELEDTKAMTAARLMVAVLTLMKMFTNTHCLTNIMAHQCTIWRETVM